MTKPKGGITSKAALAVLARVREVACSLPAVVEAVDKFGHVSFRVRDKPFVIMEEHGAPPSLAVKTHPLVQERLLRRPGFRRTPYIGQHGWVSVVPVPLDDWEEIRYLIIDAFELVAPKRLRTRVRDVEEPEP